MKSIENEVILLTGATAGIGELTAHRLAQKGARLLIHGRNAEKLRRVKKKIRESTGNEKIETYRADFSSLDEVRKLADEICSDHEKLDVLINNAGVGFSNEREESEDGYELRFAVNYLAPFLLTYLLLPALKKATPARIVNVSSAGQHAIDFDDVMLQNHYDDKWAYRQSKAALIMFSIDLAKRLENENITVNSVHPGTYLNTKMMREAGINPMGKVEDGAEAEVYLATSAELEKVTGKYFDQKTEARAIDQVYDQEAREKLWNLSEKLTGL